MPTLEARITALEAQPSPQQTDADLAAAVHCVIVHAPLPADRDLALREMLQRYDAGLATDDDLRLVAGCNIAILRTVAKLESSV